MRFTTRPSALLASCLFASSTLAADILKTNGFSDCATNADITVQKLNIEYDRTSQQVVFDVAGSSAKEQEVMAKLVVYAYGNEVYKNEFDPCAEGTKVDQLCPVPAGNFAASGSQEIPSEFAGKIPSIAFSVPDLDGTAKMELTAKDGTTLACIQSTVNNGKSANVPGVQYVVAGVAAGALIFSGLSALGAAANPGAVAPSPTFGEVVGYFQGIAMNGMLSVQYPKVYRSFTQNFAFSTGLVPWDTMQISIDNFREKTGGNLTEDSVKFLRNATLVYPSDTAGLTKRALSDAFLFARDVSTSVNGTENDTSGDNKIMHTVEGIQSYVETLQIPNGNTFMTILLAFAIAVAAIIVGILLFKVILEAWALFGTFPKSLVGFRKRYWWLVAKTITNLVLILYGIWVLYCVYQFTNGDSWAAKTLAGVTLALFTILLAGFTWRIWSIARKYKKSEGDVSGLYDNKDVWVKYSLFYDSYKKGYWWLFVPAIVYMFAKGCVIAGANGKGLVQTGGQLIIESLMLILLLWYRPYSLKSGNWINIVIQVVRVLSVACILIFVQELGLSQTTQTVTGVVLIAVQSALTAVLAILIAVNAIIFCCKENPHRKKRKEAEKAKLSRDLDNLTPLSARNSLLMDTEYRRAGDRNSLPMLAVGPARKGYNPVDSTDNLHGAHQAAPSYHQSTRSISPPTQRQPRLPDVETGYTGRAY